MTAEAGLIRRRLEASAVRRLAQPRARILVAFVVAAFVTAGVFVSSVAYGYDGARTTVIAVRDDSSNAVPELDFLRAPPTAAGAQSAYDDRSNSARAFARPIDQGVAPRSLPRTSLPSPADAADLVRGAKPVGSALKGDVFHRPATWAVDDIASSGSVYRYVGGDGVQRTLIQAPGELNGIAGRFEWIVDDAGNLTHQMFVKGGSINGMPIRP